MATKTLTPAALSEAKRLDAHKLWKHAMPVIISYLTSKVVREKDKVKVALELVRKFGPDPQVDGASLGNGLVVQFIKDESGPRISVGRQEDIELVRDGSQTDQTSSASI